MINIKNNDLTIDGTTEEILKEVGQIVAIVRDLLIRNGMDKKTATIVLDKTIAEAYRALEAEEVKEKQ